MDYLSPNWLWLLVSSHNLLSTWPPKLSGHKIPLFAAALTVYEPKHFQTAFLSQPTLPGPLSTVLISFRDPGFPLQPQTKSHPQTRARFLCSKPFSFRPLRPDHPSPAPMVFSNCRCVFRSQVPSWHYWQRTRLPMKETCDVGSHLGLGRSLEEGMATHSSMLAWRIPWPEVHRVAQSWM